jgi:phage anti-repressor protein
MDTGQAEGVPVAIRHMENGEWVDARELHAALGVGREFPTWIKGRIEECGFLEGFDYHPAKSGGFSAGSGGKSSRGRPRDVYLLTLDMAKELCMLEKNEMGRKIRTYFIKAEQAARSYASAFSSISLVNLQRAAICNEFCNTPLRVNTVEHLLYYGSMKPPLRNTDIAKLLGISSPSVCHYMQVVRPIMAATRPEEIVQIIQRRQEERGTKIVERALGLGPILSMFDKFLEPNPNFPASGKPKGGTP